MNERILTIDIPEKKKNSYNIYINDENISSLKDRLDRETEGRKRLVVFSQKVYKIYGKELGFKKSEVFVLKDGECQKNIRNFEKIIKRAIELKLSRKDVIIAIGGGVVGDMAGFAAAVYMRGIEFIQVPTTLLACVDSSVGGKTAIDMPHGKNFVGAFYQPKSVYINLNFLKTLDEKQYKSGFGEVIKYAFIEKSCEHSNHFDLAKYLTENREKYYTKDLEFLAEIITICLSLKCSVVEKDEQEKGLRKILNLGHTFGHALEEETKYRRFTHGLGVVYGIKFVFNYSLEHGYCTREYYDFANTLINMYDYPTEDIKYINKKNVLELMKTDKKANSGIITLIIPAETGVVKEIKLSDTDDLKFSTNYIYPTIEHSKD